MALFILLGTRVFGRSMMCSSLALQTLSCLSHNFNICISSRACLVPLVFFPLLICQFIAVLCPYDVQIVCIVFAGLVVQYVCSQSCYKRYIVCTVSCKIRFAIFTQVFVVYHICFRCLCLYPLPGSGNASVSVVRCTVVVFFQFRAYEMMLFEI